MTETKGYNGYKNYQTWNVVLWLDNDETLYTAARDFMEKYKGSNPYRTFIQRMEMTHSRTPDNVKWLSSLINKKEVNEYMEELKIQ